MSTSKCQGNSPEPAVLVGNAPIPILAPIPVAVLGKVLLLLPRFPHRWE